MPAKKTDVVIEIKKPNLVRVPLKLVGDSSLIVHAWSEKAKREMLEVQQKKATAKKAKPVRDPAAEYCDSMYWLKGKPDEKTEEAVADAFANGALTGFPVTAIKQAAISAAYRAGMVPNMAGLRGTFFLNGTDNPEMVTIKGDAPEMREDMVRLSGIGNPADLRYRAEYKRWTAEFVLTFNDNGVYTLEQIINILDAGGFACGIGEWRPEKDGQHGMYHIEMNGGES